MEIIVQVLCLLVIITIGYFVFKTNTKKFDVKTIVLIALFTVLRQVLTSLSIQIPLFGVPSLRIGISQIPLMVAGVLLGPAAAFVLGLVVDIVGLVADAVSYPFLGFTLGNIMVALLPALLTIKFKDKKKPLNLLYILLLGIWVLNVIAIWSVKELKFSDEVLLPMTFTNRLLCLLTVAVLLGIILLTYRFVSRKVNKDKFQYELWFAAVILVELIVNIIMTPFWLQVMYGIPFFASSAIRILKATLMINIEGVLGYLILSSCYRFLKQEP